MIEQIEKDKLNLLFSYDKTLSRFDIADIVGCNDTTARKYKAIVDNIGVIEKPTKHKDDGNRVLVIGDLHAPFTLDGYLEFCIGIKNKHQCTDIVFIGDILDNHYASFHDTDPDGYGALEELRLAKETIAKFYQAFPIATVTKGNHDQLPDRKAFTSGLSNSWIKKIEDVIEVPNWKFVEDITLDDVLYNHGTGRKARQRAKNDMTSVVQGHYHSESYIEHFVGLSDHIWAMQVGCGIDRKSYAMAYGKHFDKPHINCGVILNNGTLPILEYMNL